MKKNFVNKIGFLTMLILTGISSYLSYKVISKTIESINWVNHTIEATHKITLLKHNIFKISVYRNYYLLNNKNKIFLQKYNDGINENPKLIEKLEELVKDNPEQIKNIEELKILIKNTLPTIYMPVSVNHEYISEIINKINIMIKMENNLLETRTEEANNFKEIAIISSISLFITNSILTILLYLIIKNHDEKIAKKLLLQSEDLSVKNKELEQFAYVASHDLKAPLRAIANLTTWLSEDIKDLPENSKKHMELLLNRVTRMENLIDGILQYSRIGRINTEEKMVDVNEVLKDIIFSLDNKNIKVQPNLPKVKSNPIVLNQLFLNLISNAIKHNKKDVIVKVGVNEKENFYEFYVQDNGEGIDPKFHDKLFVIFQTIRPKDETEGTGIGLALCKKIVEGNGGKIWLESQVDKGAKFIFTWRK